MKVSTFIIMAWVLGACASLTAPAGPAVQPPQIAGATFTTADGLALPLRSWLPDGSPRAVVIALHGFNDYSKAFDKVPEALGVGPYLSERGVAVYAYDQRGFGAAPFAGLWPGGDTLVVDFSAFVRLTREKHPGVPLFALGESMGGAVVMSAMAGADPPQLDGAILSAPAVWGRATMPAIYRIALWVGAHVVPGWRPTGQSLGRLASDNIEMLRDNGRDPLFIKKTRIDAVYGLVNLMDRAFAVAGTLRGPVLYLYGRHDEIIPAKPSAEAMAGLLTHDPQARAAFYDNGFHMLERDKNGPTVLGDIAAFIDNPATTKLPSGADRDARARLQEAAKKKRSDY